MDLIATSPLVVGSIVSLSTFAMDALVERLLTIVLAVIIIGSLTAFALSAFTWLWLKHTVGMLLHLRPSPARC